MLIVFKKDAQGTEYELRGEDTTLEQVVFMVESGIRILKKSGLRRDDIIDLVNHALNMKEDGLNVREYEC